MRAQRQPRARNDQYDAFRRRSRAITRRRLLTAGSAAIGGGVLGAGAAAAAETDNLPPNLPEWMKAPGDPTGSQPYGAPSPFEKGVVKNISKTLEQYISASSRTPLQELDGIITPNGLFYERHHGGVPTIDPAPHRLILRGLVERPLMFTMDDLRRFPSEWRIQFLECSGNPGYGAGNDHRDRRLEHRHRPRRQQSAEGKRLGRAWA
ncbi:DMSO/TMAO reductase YedYZ molybdopterin-dependent catalytic subunit [Bradyrhizobium sp. USDA 4486]